MNDPTNLNGTAKAVIALFIMAFCYAMIAWLNISGKDSELARSTLGWCFITPLALLAGIGFGGVLDLIKLKVDKQ